jgi:nucleoside-diphosphate-sugar epimerase
MHVFVAGGSGVIGVRLIPLLLADDHRVTAMTRTSAKVDLLRSLGATPALCDVYDAAATRAALWEAQPDAVVHQLTDLPDDEAAVAAARRSNATIREIGTDHLVAASQAVGVERLVVQSIAWLVDGKRPRSVVHLEDRTLAARGVVVRYGRWYGPGTYHAEPPAPPRIDIDRAARLTVDALARAPGIYVATDDGLGPAP